jgi:hypothetical protein
VATTDSKIPFALDSNGILVTIDQVKRGLNCNCTCPGCGERMIAKKGEVMQAHFAHASGSQCANGYESALHLAVKQIIFDMKFFTLPECNFTIYKGMQDKLHQHYSELDPRKKYKSFEEFENNNKDILAFAHIPSIKCSFEQVDLEVSQGNIRPDIICTLGGKKLYVEVAVTHFVDDVKMAKLHARGISTLEIDVSSLRHADLSFEKLEDFILNNGKNKKWLINSHAKTLASRDEPLRADRAAARELIRKKEEEKRDAERLQKALRDKQIQDKFAATHEATFLHGRQQNIFLKLCKKHISIVVKPAYIDSIPVSRTKILAETYHGKYIEKYRKWEFSSSLDIFYLLAQAFNHDCTFIKFLCPPEDQNEFLTAVNLKKEIPAPDGKVLIEAITESTNKESRIAALQAARKAIIQKNQENQNLSSQFPPIRRLIIYYSSKEEFLSLPDHTENDWELCQLAQFQRNFHTHSGYYYVDFEHANYCVWLGNRKDSKSFRSIWAEENIHQGWPIH